MNRNDEEQSGRVKVEGSRTEDVKFGIGRR